MRNCQWVAWAFEKGKKDKVIEKSFAMVKRILTLHESFHDLFGHCYLKYNVLNRNEVIMEVRSRLINTALK
jgi:hypothetical protein